MLRIPLPGLLRSPRGVGHVRFEAEPNGEVSQPARDLLAYCAERQHGRYLARADFRPADVTRLLPNLLIAAPLPGDDLIVRLAGTTIVDRLGLEPTGMTVRELFEPNSASQVIGQYYAVCESAQPVVFHGRHYGLGHDFVFTEVVNVPMLGMDGRTVHLLGALFFPV